VNRNTKTLCITDFLPYLHPVTYLHQWDAGGADVLLHGNNHLLGGDGLKGNAGGGHFLIILGVDAAEKRAFHNLLTSLCSNQ
jgi:hypothetical protein